MISRSDRERELRNNSRSGYDSRQETSKSLHEIQNERAQNMDGSQIFNPVTGKYERTNIYEHERRHDNRNDLNVHY